MLSTVLLFIIILALLVFVHEFAGDYRSWEPQVRYFSRRYRCITYSARGYFPSEVPESPERYSQERWREEFMAAMRSMRPRFIVVTRGDRWWWAPDERTSEELIDDFPAFRDLIARRYERDREIGKYLVYRRIEGGGPP